MKIWPGKPYPLGTTCDGEGTHFSIFSEVAERVELCLFDGEGKESKVDLPEVSGFCWHGYVPGVGPGQRYASKGGCVLRYPEKSGQPMVPTGGWIVP